MSRQLLVSKPFVPQGSITTPNPPVIRFSADGRGLPLIALKNTTVAVPNGTLPAMQDSGASNPTITFRTMWPGYAHNSTARTINGASFDRTRLAAEIAKHVANYFASVKSGNIASSDPSSGIVERRLTLQDVYLEGIVNTAGTCWQAIIYIAGP